MNTSVIRQRKAVHPLHKGCKNTNLTLIFGEYSHDDKIVYLLIKKSLRRYKVQILLIIFEKIEHILEVQLKWCIFRYK